LAIEGFIGSAVVKIIEQYKVNAAAKLANYTSELKKLLYSIDIKIIKIF
jgi:hypothetical protein